MQHRALVASAVVGAGLLALTLALWSRSGSEEPRPGPDRPEASAPGTSERPVGGADHRTAAIPKAARGESAGTEDLGEAAIAAEGDAPTRQDRPGRASRRGRPYEPYHKDRYQQQASASTTAEGGRPVGPAETPQEGIEEPGTGEPGGAGPLPIFGPGGGVPLAEGGQSPGETAPENDRGSEPTPTQPPADPMQDLTEIAGILATESAWLNGDQAGPVQDAITELMGFESLSESALRHAIDEVLAEGVDMLQANEDTEGAELAREAREALADDRLEEAVQLVWDVVSWYPVDPGAGS